MTLHPYKPIPWETFTLVEPPTSTRRRTRTRIFYILAGIAVAVGSLFGLNH